MNLYQFALSPNCQKVVAVAHEVGVPLTLVELDVFKGAAKAPPMLARNPNGRVPILEDGDFVLWESNAMLGYIAGKAGRTDLAPTAPRDRADVDRWLAWGNAHFGPAVRKVAFERIVKKLAGRGAPDEVAVKAGVEEFATVAAVLERCLEGRDYLCGRLTIADFANITYAALCETALPESHWVEPCPSPWLDGADPATAYTVKESVALAFIAALQVLTPAQRAVLLLRDVVELTADETAAALATSVSAANSTLHRAREALAARIGPRATWSPDAGPPVDPSLLERYVRVWETSDVEAIVALLHDEVVLSMPPHPTWIDGRVAVACFYEKRIGTAIRGRLFRARSLEASGQPAVAFYRRDPHGVTRFFALHVLETEGHLVRRIDHFMGPPATRAVVAAGLALVLP